MFKLTLYEMNDTKRIKKRKKEKFYWANGLLVFL